MIHHRVIQGSEDWLRLRMGKPTASEFEKIITPKKWEATKGETRRAYIMHLLAELILDTPLSGVTTAAMQHGHDWEPKARAAYEMMRGVDVDLCGFCTDDAGIVGASPDGFVGEDGSVEIKCPEKPEIHCGYMLAPDTLKEAYFVQTQGQLYVTGRKWTDLVSYFGGMPMVCERVKPVVEFREKLDAAVKLFVSDLALYIDLAKTRGWIKEPKPERDRAGEGVTMEDLEMILESRRANAKD
jgi:YqaJ-like viral recombinase domain